MHWLVVALFAPLISNCLSGMDMEIHLFCVNLLLWRATAFALLFLSATGPTIFQFLLL